MLKKFLRNPVAAVSDMWQINKLPHNHRIPHNNLHSLCFQMAMRTKAEFDREFILTQLPEKYEYVLNTWNVMGNRRFFVEGRVVGDFDTDKVKKWLEQFYESSGASYNKQTGRSDINVDSKPGQCHFR